MRRSKDDMAVQAVACLMGCKANYGLARRISELDETHKFKTVGDIYRAVLLDMLKEEVTS